MNLFQRAIRSCLRKPVKSILLLLVIGTISLLFLSGMASRSANVAAKDSTRQAIGAGFLLEGNPENRNKRLQEAFEAIEEKFGVGQSGSYQGVHAETIISNGQPSGYVWTDHSFESLVREDIEKIAAASGISDYNITTVPTPVKPEGFSRIEDPDKDQTYDSKGVSLVGNRTMNLDSNVLNGVVTIKDGRMTVPQDQPFPSPGLPVLPSFVTDSSPLQWYQLPDNTVPLHCIGLSGTYRQLWPDGAVQMHKSSKNIPHLSSSSLS